MTEGEFAEIVRHGENSGVEFNRDDVANHDLAKELVAFLNLDGGVVLLGVEDDGTLRGTMRENLEQWVVELCRTKIDPPTIPFLAWQRQPAAGRDVLAVRVPVGADKPYARVHNNRSTYFVRVGSTSREASRDELERMFQASGRLRYGVKPVPGATFDNLDQRRLRDYFVRVLDGDAPADEDVDEWWRLLANLDLAVAISGQNLATVDAMLLFGRDPKRFLPQSGVRAICYCGAERDYATRADEDVTGPLTPFCSPDGRMLEPGLVDLAWDFMRRNTVPTSYLDGPRRVDRWEFPEPVVREVLVNALAHRDYSIAGADILLEIFSD